MIILSISCFIFGASGQSNATFSSFLATNQRKYSCPGEIVTYVCNGSGYEIDIYAPPYIGDMERLAFSKSDRVGSGLGTGPIGSVLFSTDGDYISVGVAVREYDLGRCDIFCEIHSSTGTSRATIEEGRRLFRDVCRKIVCFRHTLIIDYEL